MHTVLWQLEVFPIMLKCQVLRGLRRAPMMVGINLTLLYPGIHFLLLRKSGPANFALFIRVSKLVTPSCLLQYYLHCPILQVKVQERPGYEPFLLLHKLLEGV